jgi:hypothetical protein
MINSKSSTISLRRPPAFKTLATNVKGETIERLDTYADHQEGQFLMMRRATSWDFVNKEHGVEDDLYNGIDGRYGELQGGPISVEADQETFQVS